MKKTFNSEIGILRFVFATLIFLVHAYSTFHLTVFGDANFAVEFFFFLSGFYLASYVTEKEKSGENGAEACRNYLAKRFFKILPILLVAILYGFVLMRITSDAPFVKKDLLYIFGEILPVQGYSLPATSFTGVTWYLSVLFFGLAVLYPVLSRWNSWFIQVYSVVIGLLLYGLLAVFTGNLSNPGSLVLGILFKGGVRGFAAMCFGCFIYGTVGRIERVPVLKHAAVRVILRILSYGIVIAGMAFLNDSPYLFPLLLPYVIAVTLSLYRPENAKAAPAWVEKTAKTLQALSLPMYLLHFPTVRAVEWASGSFLAALAGSPWGKTAVAYAVTIALAFLYLAAENGVKRLFAKKTA